MTADVMASAASAPAALSHDHDTRTPRLETPTNETTQRAGTSITVPVAGAFLLLDAGDTGVNGLAYAARRRLARRLVRRPESLVRSLGVFLLVVAVGVALLATRAADPPPRGRGARRPQHRLGVASLDYALVGGLTTLGVAWTVLQPSSWGCSPPDRCGWRAGADTVTTMTEHQQRRPKWARSSALAAAPPALAQALSDQCGVSTRHLSDIETGRARPSPTWWAS